MSAGFLHDEKLDKIAVKVTRAGWFNFEGFGRPFEGWADSSGRGHDWRSAGRAFTRAGANRKAVSLGRARYAVRDQVRRAQETSDVWDSAEAPGSGS